MKISEQNIKNYTVVAIDGRLDTNHCDTFEKQMMEIVTRSNHLILDCKNLEYISSSGLRIFLVLQKKLMALSGQMKLCQLQPAIKEIFEISGFTMIFSIFSDLEKALES